MTNGWLNKEDSDRLIYIRGFIKKKWKNNITPPYYTIHDHTHSKAVEEMLHQIIPMNKLFPSGNKETKPKSRLNEKERFILLVSAWLHDIGMISGLFKKNESFVEVRENHHLRSGKYIRNNYSELGLSYDEAVIISEICKYHRKSEDIFSCSEKQGNIKVRLLAAYLRLADALHIDNSRETEALYKIFLSTGMPWESRFHWIKTRWVNSISINESSLSLVINIKCSKEEEEEEDGEINMLSDIIKEEVVGELESVKDILILGKINYFLDVKINKEPIDIASEMLIDLKEILSHRKVDISSSSSEIANAMIDTILHLCKQKEIKETYRVIKDYYHNVVEKITEERPCHLISRRIGDIVYDCIGDDTTNTGDEKELKRILDKLEIDLISFKEKRQKCINNLTKNAGPILTDGTPILLFGYSKLVVNCLDTLQEDIKRETTLYVTECKSKSIFGYNNELISSDGMYYALELRKIGFEKVLIIPDIIVGNLISRDFVSKVVFGANGIDITTGNFGHTAGHLTIAVIAHYFDIPVYVIADKYKFGDLKHDPDLIRDINWLTMDKKWLKKISDKDIKTYNPREDLVDPEKTYMLITDIGMFPPTMIPDKIIEDH